MATRRIETRELIETVRRVAQEQEPYRAEIRLHLQLAAAELERLAYPSGPSVLGIKVVVDESMPPGTVEMRGPHNTVRVENLAVDCRSIAGRGVCDMCAQGDYEKCRYAAPQTDAVTSGSGGI